MSINYYWCNYFRRHRKQARATEEAPETKERVKTPPVIETETDIYDSTSEIDPGYDTLNDCSTPTICHAKMKIKAVENPAYNMMETEAGSKLWAENPDYDVYDETALPVSAHPPGDTSHYATLDEVAMLNDSLRLAQANSTERDDVPDYATVNKVPKHESEPTVSSDDASSSTDAEESKMMPIAENLR